MAGCPGAKRKSALIINRWDIEAMIDAIADDTEFATVVIQFMAKYPLV
jgi:hypothetical protein